MGGPSPSYNPPPPPPPAPVVATTGAGSTAEADAQAKRRRSMVDRRAAGREGTILTSGLGVTKGNQTLGG
jgi:hypothetical protein